jgi:hypothetical protein
MKGLLFLSRLAFICNCLFVLCLVLQRTPDILHSQDLKGLIIILGWAGAPILNFVVNIWQLGLLVYKRSSQLPKWLILSNLLFLIIQFFYF